MNSLVWQVRFDWVGSFPQVRRTVVTRVHEAVKALALCHNVTPVTDDTENQSTRIRIDSATSEESDAGGLEGGQTVNYQASSPDEVTMLIVILCPRDWTRLDWHKSRRKIIAESLPNLVESLLYSKGYFRVFRTFRFVPTTIWLLAVCFCQKLISFVWICPRWYKRRHCTVKKGSQAALWLFTVQ